MAGCGGPGEASEASEPPSSAVESAAPSPSPSEEPTTEPAVEAEKVSLLDTCLALFGDDPVAVEARTFLDEVDSLDADTAVEAAVYSFRLEEVAATAEAQLAEPIRATRGILDDFSAAWDESGSWELDTKAFNEAAVEIQGICGAELEAVGAESEPAPPELTDEEQAEAAFLSEVRAAHPRTQSEPDADIVDVATAFCTIYGKAGAAPVVEQAITLAAGIQFSEGELRSIKQAGITMLCPEHADQLG
ncbi:hypothetical protein DXT87_14445 [Arthrobacter sp. AET 35A]|nr:hypothetical protein [Arthrobacter sp. AET 35A]